MRARLLCRARPGETRGYELTGEQALIGRDDAVQVDLPFEEVSRRHARISWDGKQHWIEDLESTNGTFVNGRRVGKQREKLRHLSVLTLGKAPDLVFVIKSEETQALRRTVIAHAFLVREAGDALPYEIAIGEFTVGRSATCNIVSESTDISKVHARLLRSADKLIVRDLGSANGTWVNRVRVAEAPLLDGDLVAFAGEEYRVSLSLAEVTSATTSLLRAQAVAAAAAAKVETPRDETPRFSSDWKQRAMGPLEKAPLTTVPTAEPSPAPAAAAGRIEVRLLGAGAELVVTGGGSYALGSAAGLPLRVEHPSVAATHARLIVSDALGTVFVQREDGKTSRNGKESLQPEPLSDGDVLQVGEAILRVGIQRVDGAPD